jgi:hypothetical protein
MNLTNKYSVKARNHKYGGINCFSSRGPSFGEVEFLINEPFLEKNNILSRVSRDGFSIEGGYE